MDTEGNKEENVTELTIIPKENLDPAARQRLYNMPPVTENQAKMMLHAIGADRKNARDYMGRQIYHAYRNHYDAGGKDIEAWNDLVNKGYSEGHDHFYHVTPLGLDLLELLTGRSTIYDNYNNYADCRTAVLTRFLKADVYCGYGCWFPTSAADTSRLLHIPVNLVREACRNMAEEGYLVKGHSGGVDDDGQIRCYHGYYITDKARGLEKWKALHDAEMAYLNKTLNAREDEA